MKSTTALNIEIWLIQLRNLTRMLYPLEVGLTNLDFSKNMNVEDFWFIGFNITHNVNCLEPKVRDNDEYGSISFDL